MLDKEIWARLLRGLSADEAMVILQGRCESCLDDEAWAWKTERNEDWDEESVPFYRHVNLNGPFVNDELYRTTSSREQFGARIRIAKRS